MPSLRFCGPKCMVCCLITSVWGILMLSALGVLYKADSVYVDPTLEMTYDERQDAGTQCFIAAGIYGVTLAITVCQYFTPRPKVPEKVITRRH